MYLLINLSSGVAFSNLFGTKITYKQNKAAEKPQACIEKFTPDYASEKEREKRGKMPHTHTKQTNI